MAASRQGAASIFDINLRTGMVALFLGLMFATVMIAAPAAQAQTFQVLHNFAGGLDGASPYTGLTMDRSGNLYGTATSGGFLGNDCAEGNAHGCGTVFKLARRGDGWVLTPIYQFQGFIHFGSHGDGAEPGGRVTIGPDGNLYGTTYFGGVNGHGCGGEQPGCGTVFKLSPQPTTCRSFICNWEETQLYNFTGSPDGAGPGGEIAFDSAGNLYGATEAGGTQNSGTVFELSAAQGWREAVLYDFTEEAYGPIGGVALDQAGNIYGTTWQGGAGGNGILFQLAASGSGWTLNTLHPFGFENDGLGPYGGVILDRAGKLYGGTVNGTPNGGAVVYEMSPSDGGWTYNILYTFVQSYGGGPAADLVMDAAGSLYGTTRGLGDTGNPWGNVFKLTPSGSGWIYTDLHDFTGGSDGGVPYSSVVVDSNGNLYGTATVGGTNDLGVVWEITP